MAYKILIDKSGAKLVEVPSRLSIACFAKHFDRPQKEICLGNRFECPCANYDQALSTALADESKHIEFMEEEFVMKLIYGNPKELIDGLPVNYYSWLDSAKGKSYDIPSGYDVSILERFPPLAVLESQKPEVVPSCESDQKPIEKALIEFLRKQENKPYIASSKGEWTTHELADEVEKGTEMGIQMVSDLVLLTADRILRGKEKLPSEDVSKGADTLEHLLEYLDTTYLIDRKLLPISELQKNTRLAIEHYSQSESLKARNEAIDECINEIAEKEQLAGLNMKQGIILIAQLEKLKLKIS